MATTIDDLKSLLEGESAPAFDNGTNTVISPFHHEGYLFNMEMNLQNEGKFLQIKIPYFLNLYEASSLEKTLIKLLELNRKYQAMKFSLDPCDGEISVGIEIPLQDADFTQEQLDRCRYCLMYVAMYERVRLLTLFRTGIYPSSDDPAFTEKVDQLMTGMEAA